MAEHGAAAVPGARTRPLQLCTCCREPLAPGTDVCPRCNTDVRGGARSQSARSALVFGIVGLAILPIVFSIPAIVMAVRARREIARTPGLHGSDAAGWGLATGIAGLGLGIILIFTVVVGFINPT